MKRILAILFAAATATAQTLTDGGANFTGPINGGASATGTDAYAITTAPHAEGRTRATVNLQCFTFQADVANTGPATLAVDGRSAVAIKKRVGGAFSDPTDGEIQAGGISQVCYQSTQGVFVLTSRPGVEASSGGALTSNAGDAPFYPFGAISSYDVHALSANTIYLDAFTTQVSMQFRKCAFYVTTAAASGKGARCMVYTRASNGDVTVVAKSDGVLVDTTTTKTPSWSSGSLVSGGVLTLPAAQNYYIALVSDGAPQIAAYALAGTQYLFRNGWNGSTFTVLSMVHSTSGVTGTGVNVDVGASITVGNLNANLDRRLGYVGFLP